jgi:hypothetical protein
MDDFSVSQILALLSAVDCRISVLASCLARLNYSSSSYVDIDNEISLIFIAF